MSEQCNLLSRRNNVREIRGSIDSFMDDRATKTFCSFDCMFALTFIEEGIKYYKLQCEGSAGCHIYNLKKRKEKVYP